MPDRITETELERIYDETIAELYGYASRRCGGQRELERYSQGEAYARYVSARERTVDYLLTLVPYANGLLIDAQRRRLPLQISNYLDRRVLKFLRSSTLGDGSPFAR